MSEAEDRSGADIGGAAAVANGASEAEDPAPPSWFTRLRDMLGLRNGFHFRRDFEHALASDAALAAFSPGERAMIRNILRLSETRVDDVMVPRADIESVEIGTTLAELLRAFERAGHSRMPVYRETLDDPAGMVHIKDLLVYVASRAAPPVAEPAEGESQSVSGPPVEAPPQTPAPGPVDLSCVDLSVRLADTRLVRNVLFAPPSMPATDLLGKMQATRIQMALVIDEYGGTDGLVSLEDIVETIVGEIEDEHDDDEGPMVTPGGEGIYVADARAPLEEVAAAIGPGFPVDGEDVDTIGGLLIARLGRVPVRGELLAPPEMPGFEIEVLEADPRRLKKVRIFARPATAAERASAERRRRRAEADRAQAEEGG
jgi:CBS domain containing-hemolysin-like protein